MRFFSSSIATARSNIRKCSRDRIPKVISSRSARHFSTTASVDIEKDRNWSGLLSFSSPEADFTAFQRPAGQEVEEDYEIVSYASPETATGNIYVQVPKEQNWMKTLEDEMEQNSVRLKATTKHNWMNIQEDEVGVKGSEWSRQISFASPEADFTSFGIDTDAVPDERIESEWSGLLSFASPEADFTSSRADTDKMQEQLPKTLQEAMLPSSQAIVVTSAKYPHPIVHVNSAWEGLCGYDAKESLGKSLKILQGPETDVNTVRESTKKMLKGEDLEDVEFDVVNYNKQGRKFFNRVRMGVLRSEADEKEVTHFVGVLREICEEGKYLGTTEDKIRQTYS